MENVQANAQRKGTTTRGMQIVDMKLEVVVIPVADVERAKAFYGGLGWRLDAELGDGKPFRAIQMTPPGSQCSVHFGTGITPAAPGSAQMYLVVSDIETARAQLIARGVAVSDFFGVDLQSGARLPGPDRERRSYATYAAFTDPDGNRWILQEITARLPGRVDAPAFASASELADALRRAEAAHGEHEKRTGQRDADWPNWYAAYMVAEQAGKPLPS